MIDRVPRSMTRSVSRWLPDPLIFTILLTLLIFVIVLWLTPQTPIGMAKMWGDSFWNLLAFSMQMALIIVTGHTLASSAPVRSLSRTVASAVKTPVQGVMLVTFFGSVACIINWRSGLVVGIVLAREVTRRVPGSDYPLLIAYAYVGFLTWGGSFSGSIPLLVVAPGDPVEHIAGLIPVGDTLFSGFNTFITMTLIVMIPFTTRMMMPKPSDAVSIDPKLPMGGVDFRKQLPKDAPPFERLEESRILTLIVGALGIAYLTMCLSEHGFNITISTVNLMFMIAGLLLHRMPTAYMRAISAATHGTAGILVQFPFYAGVQPMMERSGLGGLITESLINIVNKDTFPVMTFFSSALINLVVPSGSGHWVTQGPFVIPAAQTLGADLGKSVMAIAYDEQWINMAQPFQTLTALAVTGLGVRDIIGYYITTLLLSGVIFVIGLTLFWRQSCGQREYKMEDYVIVSAIRTAVGSFNDSLASTSAIDLRATVARAATERAKIDSLHIDEVIMGNVLQTGLGQNPARQALSKDGLAEMACGFTVNKVCGSGLKSVALTAQTIQAGQAQSIVAGGMENMSLAPYLLDVRAHPSYRLGDGQVYDVILRNGLMCATHGYHMGITAENVAKEYGTTREMQDGLVLHSQRKATAAVESGAFIAEIVPVNVVTRKKTFVFSQDGFPKTSSTTEALGALHPAFDKAGAVTAGNASGTSDGATALVIMEESVALAAGLIPLARIKSYTSSGVPSVLMGVGPVPATQKALQLAELQLADIDLIEANEAFVVQLLAARKTLGFDPEKVNTNGGAIALGYPIGASGARILVTLLHVMQARDRALGLTTPCVGGGQRVAVVIERLN